MEEAFVCPITQCAMTDPVMLSDGYSYERKAISEWLKIKKISPMTRKKVQFTNLVTNRSLLYAMELQGKCDKGELKVLENELEKEKKINVVLGKEVETLTQKLSSSEKGLEADFKALKDKVNALTEALEEENKYNLMLNRVVARLNQDVSVLKAGLETEKKTMGWWKRWLGHLLTKYLL